MRFDRLRVDTADNIGENWLIAECGNDMDDGEDYIVTTDRVHTSELSDTTAREYAQLFAAAPYLYHLVEKQVEAMGNTPMSDMNYAGIEWLRQAKIVLEKVDAKNEI